MKLTIPDLAVERRALAGIGKSDYSGYIWKLAHTFLLMGVAALVELDPEANSPLGRLLIGTAAAVEEFEKEIYPIGKQKKAKKWKMKGPPKKSA